MNIAHSETQFERRYRENRLKQAPSDPAIEPRAPRRDVKPDGKRKNRTSSGANEGGDENVRSSRDDCNEKSCCPLPCDSPRALLIGPKNAFSDAGDVDKPVHAGRLSRFHWPGSVDSPSASTSGEPLRDKWGCSNDRKDDREGMTARNPCEGIDESGDEMSTALEIPADHKHAVVGPREVLLPESQVSRRSANFCARRFLISTHSLTTSPPLPA